tara:strand:+ start:1453 stop:1974 length:522 start_codon:yes stop_codon:yes gene_type:complete
MRLIILFFFILSLTACNKPKTVFICGDHVCINKAEAEQYFEDNLTLEVKIVDNNRKENNDLVELNLSSKNNNEKEIIVISKEKTNKKLKILSNKEIAKRKAELKKKKKKKKEQSKEIVKLKKTKDDINKVKNGVKIDNICSLLKDCNIDEISEFLVKQGKKKKFPDITERGEQ